MISIKLMDMHIDHDRSVQVCLIRDHASHCIASHRFGAMRHFRSLLVRWRVGSGYILVLVFTATRKEMSLPVLFDPKNKMSKLSMYMSKSSKIRMDYSKHGIYM